MMPEYGIDVSSNNGAIDWPTVSRYLHTQCSNPFVMVKVSEGLSYVNPQWYRDRMGAHAAGLQVGLYHFCRPSVSSGHDEASAFFNAIGKSGGILPGETLAIDLEDTGVAENADLLAYALDFLGTIERALGIKPFIYSGDWYAYPHRLKSQSELASYPLWWVDYTISGPAPMWTMRQYGIGYVQGIDGNVDLDVLYGDLSTWQKYAWGFQPDPLAGQSIDVQPDVAVNPSSESLSDIGAVAKKIAEDAAALAGELSGVQQRLALTIKADADLIVRMSWGH